MAVNVEQAIERAVERAPVADVGTRTSLAVHGAVLKSPEGVRDAVDVLHGTWLGHPLHPVLTELTIGAWFIGGALDAVGALGRSRRARYAGDRLAAIGTACAIPTALTGLEVRNLAEMKAAASRLHDLGAKNVVVTGGDVTGDRPEKAIDLLSAEGSNGTFSQSEFASDRVRSSSTHGTGCAFATAVAANLALGKQLHDAVVMAKAFVKKAISRAYPLGKGQGPLNHLYRLEEQPRPVQDSFTPTREH